ncbi:hypothetical protein B9Z55_025702 [Caenorhabditis nigoni]|uniref:Uncharacterized protein n=1 Tax=Caenorhabditis nigoni TaxID=1611254 RepID=A0A2G5SZZ0_9PELO|nr:hypothetical protein B9Z55_025702 [Caenorhabditis nigoni]
MRKQFQFNVFNCLKYCVVFKSKAEIIQILDCFFQAMRTCKLIRKRHISEYKFVSEPIKEILLKEPLNSFPNEYESYEEAARHLFDELKVKETMENEDNKSSDNVYQILIVRAEGNNYESFFEGTGTNCFFDKQHKGFETMMCRITFNSSSWEEQFHVEHRMYNQTFVAEKLNTTIVSEMSKLNLGTKLQVIADSLKTKIGKDILNGFSGWAITRESNHTKCPDIKLWSSPYNVLALESITALSYTNKGSFTQDCEEFRFFFFM